MFSWCPLSMLGVVTLYMLDSCSVERHSWELSEEHSSLMSSIPSSEAETLLLQLVLEVILMSRAPLYTSKYSQSYRCSLAIFLSVLPGLLGSLQSCSLRSSCFLWSYSLSPGIN